MIKRKTNTNLEVKKKGKVLSTFLLFIIGGIFGASIGILSNSLIIKFMNVEGNSSKSLELFSFLGSVIIFVLGYLTHIIIHEAGHLVFGLMTGYSFVSFRIGSFTMIKESGKIKFKRFNIPGTAGQCLMMPPNFREGKYPFVIYNYGGVIMNLVVSALEILLVVLLESIAFPLNAILVLTAAGGLFAALTNGIPMKVGGVPNDAYNIFSMLRDEQAKRGFYVQLKVNGLMSLGTRIKEIPIEMFKLKENSDLSNPMNTSLRLMEYSWHLDNMDFDSAKECIDTLIPYIDDLPLLFKNETDCERMFLELVTNCNKAAIDDLYSKNLRKYIKAAKFMIGKRRLLMAYEAFYNEDKNKALEYYEGAKKLIAKYPVKGEADMELLLMEWIKGKMK
ncbi:hypothetical protein NBE98_18190 [Clostridium swellfunianum]|uniref:hypothetical protein n=1 Tax=Clostridium swellfunianum TaxID=1367462 RepID=UPI00203076DA|nr:hypothetical protein [Clostridium swellfunianum]MCM0650297.1 hypothetical protein [Clostridium swellfunianum]